MQFFGGKNGKCNKEKQEKMKQLLSMRTIFPYNKNFSEIFLAIELKKITDTHE